VELISDIRQAVYSLNSSACSDFYIDTFNITSITQRWVSFYGHGSGTKRACGDYPWGGSWSTDLASYSGDITGQAGFATQVPPNSSGQFLGIMTALPPAVSINVDLDSIVGVGVNTVVGQLLTGISQLSIAPLALNPSVLPVWATLNYINQAVGKENGTQILAADYLAGTDGAVISKRYEKFIQTIMNMTWSVQPNWVIDDTISGLKGDVTNLELVVAFRARTSDPKTYLALESAQAEIDLLKSFSEKPKRIVIKRADSLWKLAETYYSKPFFYQAVGYFNAISPKHRNKLRVGSSIVIPPLYELLSMDNVHLLLPGETITSLCHRVTSGSTSMCINDFQRANKGVRLSKLSALQPILLPQSWPPYPPSPSDGKSARAR
jgi:hypothetical protein